MRSDDPDFVVDQASVPLGCIPDNNRLVVTARHEHVSISRHARDRVLVSLERAIIFKRVSFEVVNIDFGGIAADDYEGGIPVIVSEVIEAKDFVAFFAIKRKMAAVIDVVTKLGVDGC